MSKKPAAKSSKSKTTVVKADVAGTPVLVEAVVIEPVVETPAPAAPNLGASEIISIPMDKIDVAPKSEQVRPFDKDDPEYLRKVDFAATNRKWLQNIIVRQGEGGRFTLVAGRNRFEAAKVNGWTEIEARVFADLDISTSLCVGLMENLGTKSMTKTETAAAMAAVMRRDSKASIGDFAARMNVTKNTVRNILSLNNLVTEAAKRTTKGEIPLANAYQLATLPQEVQAADDGAWINSAAETKTLKFVKAVQEFLADIKGDKTGTVRAQSKTRAKSAAKVIKPLGQTDLEAMLDEALAAEAKVMGKINLSYQDGLIDGLLIALGKKPRLPASSLEGFQSKPSEAQSL